MVEELEVGWRAPTIRIGGAVWSVNAHQGVGGKGANINYMAAALCSRLQLKAEDATFPEALAVWPTLMKGHSGHSGQPSHQPRSSLAPEALGSAQLADFSLPASFFVTASNSNTT